MALTNINSEDRLVQQTFAEYLRDRLGWESVYAYNTEVFGTLPPSPDASHHPLPAGEGRGEGDVCDLGRTSERDVVLVRDVRGALERLNPDFPASATEQAIEKLARIDFARSLAGAAQPRVLRFYPQRSAGGVARCIRRDPSRASTSDRLSQPRK